MSPVKTEAKTFRELLIANDLSEIPDGGVMLTTPLCGSFKLFRTDDPESPYFKGQRAEPKPVATIKPAESVPTAEMQLRLRAIAIEREQAQRRRERAPYLEKLERDAETVRERKGFAGHIRFARGVLNVFEKKRGK